MLYPCWLITFITVIPKLHLGKSTLTFTRMHAFSNYCTLHACAEDLAAVENFKCYKLQFKSKHLTGLLKQLHILFLNVFF